MVDLAAVLEVQSQVERHDVGRARLQLGDPHVGGPASGLTIAVRGETDRVVRPALPLEPLREEPPGQVGPSVAGEPGPRARARAELDALVKGTFVHFKSRYGAPRITRHLNDNGQPCDEKTVASSLRRQGLRAKAAKRFKATTKSDHGRPVADNVLEQDFTAAKANEKWAGDITYLWTDEGWVYLAVFLDLHSRRVVGWAMDKTMTAQLVCDALQMALWRRKRPQGVIVHTDRGSQYCSRRYQQLLAKHGLICSMSSTGNCFDNACAETFFHSMKIEAIYGNRYPTRQSVRQEVFEYIETFYNTTRLHSSLGYVSPSQFEMAAVA